MGKTNFILSTLPFNPWAVSATRLHVEAELLIKYKKNEVSTYFEQNITMNSYGTGIGWACVPGHNILEPTTGVTFFNSGSKSDPT
jgi:hypothetical protein